MLFKYYLMLLQVPSNLPPTKESEEKNVEIQVKVKNECPRKRCKKLFCSKKNLENHLKTHDKPPIVPCDECGKLLKSRKRLKWHMRKVHGPKILFKTDTESFKQTY